MHLILYYSIYCTQKYCCCHEKWASSSSFFFFSSSKSCANSPSRNQVSAGSAAALRSGTAGPHDGGGTPPGFVAHVHIPAVEHRCGRAGRWLKRMLSRCRPHPSELGVPYVACSGAACCTTAITLAAAHHRDNPLSAMVIRGDIDC